MKSNQAHARRFFGVIGFLQIAIIVLVLVTTGIHLQHGISMSAGGFAGGSLHAFPGSSGSRLPSGPPRGSGSGASGLSILQWIPLPLSTLFILNGIGYLVLVIALYLPLLSRFQRLIRWLLIIFAAATFTLYFLVNGFHLDTISLVDKIAEIALIILLLIHDRQFVRARRSEVLQSVSPQSGSGALASRAAD
jgi:hypothetical protein